MRRLVLAFAVASASAVVTASALAAPPTAAQVAASTCQTFATNQPAAFAKIFSSDADCQSTLATAAQAAVDSCTGKTGDALKACVTPLMQAAVILAGDAKKAESDAKAMKVANTVAKNA